MTADPLDLFASVDDLYYKVAIMIGRFQVSELHDGHKHVIEQVINKHKRVILFLGVPKSLGSKKNPLDFSTRKAMIKELYPDLEIAALPDHPDDILWSKEIDKRSRELYAKGDVVLYGGRDSFIPYYKGEFECKEFEEYGTNLSGTEERKRLSIEIKATKDFRHGIIYNSHNQYPKTHPAVHIICKDESNRILLCNDDLTGRYRLIGGFVGDDNSLEDTAERILLRKANLKALRFEYIGSMVVNDWRYRGEEDKVITTIFSATLSENAFIHRQNCSFVDIDKLSAYNVIPEHLDIILKFCK